MKTNACVFMSNANEAVPKGRLSRLVRSLLRFVGWT